MDKAKKMNWDAKYYRQYSSHQESAALKFIESLTFRGDERVLDIGCGAGNVTQALADKALRGEVIGIDASPEMIEQARSEYSDIPNLSFQLKAAEAFQFEQKFDLVTSFFALHWVKDHAKVLQNVKAVLKRGGRIGFLVVAGGDPRIGEVFEREPWKSEILNPMERFTFVTEKDYHELLDKLGFVQDHVRVHPVPHMYLTREEAMHNFMTWMPVATGLSQDRCWKFVGEIVENLSVEPNQQRDIKFVSQILVVQAHLPY